MSKDVRRSVSIKRETGIVNQCNVLQLLLFDRFA
jgi:hypothetical protein